MKLEINQPISNNQLLYLYNSVGWYTYTNNQQDLSKMVESSYWWEAYYDSDQLVGFIRCIGDGQTIIYVQDILIHPDYQRKKIGSALLDLALETFISVRQFVLITEDSKVTIDFYQSMGLKTLDSLGIKGFMRHD